MEAEYGYFLSLLGSFLRQEQPREAPVDWARLTDLARSQNVLGILGYLTKLAPICPDEQLAQLLQAAFRSTVVNYVQRGALADQLLQGLTDLGADHIVMKGYVLRQDYPVPELRTYGDIDLVIRPEDRERVDRWMRDQGFTPKVDWGPVLSYLRGPEFYEIHTDIMEVNVSGKADYRSYFSAMWDHVQLLRGRTYGFTPEFHFLYLLTHLAKHIRGCGAGARMYLDLGAFLLHEGKSMDWAWVERELKGLALWDFAAVALSAVEQWFGVSAPMVLPAVEPEVLKALTNFTLEAGIFGKEGREEGVNSLRKEEGGRLTVLRKRLFPGAKQIENRYTYLKEKPWLLPAAWVDRLIRNRKMLGSQVHEAQVILTADQREVSDLQRLMKEIGL